jgi:hypothetical protein
MPFDTDYGIEAGLRGLGVHFPIFVLICTFSLISIDRAMHDELLRQNVWKILHRCLLGPDRSIVAIASLSTATSSEMCGIVIEMTVTELFNTYITFKKCSSACLF